MSSQSPAVHSATRDLIRLAFIHNPDHVVRAATARRRTRPLPRVKRYDDTSTYSFHASRPIASPRSPSRRSNDSTPAQEIAATYRQRLAQRDATHSPRPSTTSQIDRVDSQSTNGGSTSMTADTSLADSEPKVRYRQSRVDAQERYLREAYLMFMGGRYEGDTHIKCRRPGCNNALPSLTDLARHLYLHDVAADQWYDQHADNSELATGHQGPLYTVFETDPVTAHSRNFRERFLRYLTRLMLMGCCCTPRVDNEAPS